MQHNDYSARHPRHHASMIYGVLNDLLSIASTMLMQALCCVSKSKSQSASLFSTNPAPHQQHFSACWQTTTHFPPVAGPSNVHSMTCDQSWCHGELRPSQSHTEPHYHPTQQEVEQLLCNHPCQKATVQVHAAAYSMTSAEGQHVVCIWSSNHQNIVIQPCLCQCRLAHPSSRCAVSQEAQEERRR